MLFVFVCMSSELFYEFRDHIPIKSIDIEELVHMDLGLRWGNESKE